MKKILPILILGSAAGMMLIVLLNADRYHNYTDNFEEEDFNTEDTFALDSEIIRKTEEMQKLQEFSFGTEIGVNMNYDEPAEEISWLTNTGEVTEKMGINYAFGRTDYNEIKADNCTLENWSSSENRLTQNNTEVLNVISSFEQYLKEVGYTKSTQNSTSSLVQSMANHGSIDYTNTVSYEGADNIVSLTHISRCVDITKEGSSEWIKASDEILSVAVGKKN